MGFFLNSLELSEQKYRSILDRMTFSVLFYCVCLFLDDMCKNGMVDGEPVNVIELLDQLEAHGAADSAVPA